MALAQLFQTMGVARDTVMVLDGPAGSVQSEVLHTWCTGTHTESPPPMQEFRDGDGNVLEYDVGFTNSTPILEAVEQARAELTDWAGVIGMPEEMYLETVTQYATWAATGIGRGEPFTWNTAEWLLGAGVAQAGRKLSDDEVRAAVQSIWAGVDLTLKLAYPSGFLPTGIPVSAAIGAAPRR